MKVDVKDGEIRITEAYVGMVFEAEHETVGICERDGGFELVVTKKDGSFAVYAVQGGIVECISDQWCASSEDGDGFLASYL